ncbi:MAG: hypothetical protein AB7V32_01040 [Candidatus Berkiella sp.]
MSFTKVTLTPEILQKTLYTFQGEALDTQRITSFHKFSFYVFANPAYISDPRIQFTAQLDITALYQNYLEKYKVSEKITFATFVKWLAIKTMNNTPFLWRQINGLWYQFNNLPLEVTMRTKKRRELELYVLENVSNATWEQFCQYHEDYKNGKYPDLLSAVTDLPIHWTAYQILNVHLPKMTSYNTTERVYYAHQPWIVFSDRYEQNGKLYLPFYMNYSHATLTPEDVEDFIKNFLANGILAPDQVIEKTKQLSGTRALEAPKEEKPTKPQEPSPDDLPF